MEETQKKETEVNILYIIIPAVALIAAAGLWFFVGKGGGERVFEIKQETVQAPKAKPETGLTSSEAMEAAIVRTKEWSKEAKLVNFSSQDGATGNQTGKSELWTFLFTSREKPKKGFEIVVANSTNSPSIQSTKEIAYSSYEAKESIAPDDIITTEEAIAKVREIAGYENAKIIEVTAEYGPLGKIWYWNVKTDKATVSIHALRNER